MDDLSEFASLSVDIYFNYLNDTTKYKMVDFAGILMNDVIRLTVGYPYGLRAAPYAKVVLRPGALDKDKEWNTTWADLKGYDAPRVFYAPTYETTSDKSDYRTTIHWEPNITTDECGEAVIGFYNADPKTRIRIVAEGVTVKGVPVTATSSYVVK